MKGRHALALTLSTVFAVTACQRDPAPLDAWLGPVTSVDAPSGPDSRYPHLAQGAGLTVLSWLEARPAGGQDLRHSTWTDGAWGPARTVTGGADWFVNWADFPSVVPMSGTHWTAHWLQQSTDKVYSYDVRIATSTDAGANWTASMTPHDDRTPTEHGFVTLFAQGDATRAVWLDGRHTGGGHDHGSASGAMTLRSAVVAPDGTLADAGEEIDARVCDCCQTDAALTSDGAVVVYRDRSEGEVRDIALVRNEGGSWSAPVHVHDDAWRIDACPVNGPAIDARDRTVAVAWFTAPDRPRVRLAISLDAGRSFAPPVEVANGDVTGRVDVVLLDDGRAIVSWLQQGPEGAQIIAQPFDRDGPAGAPVVIAGSTVQRSSGFPQMVRSGEGLLFAWTDPAEPAQVRTAYATLR